MSVVTLTGFMGTGKSTVGRRLADALGKPFIDTDAEIEAREGRSIADIFATLGEPHFRAIERQVVAESVARDAVVATGGGAIVDDDNFAAMHAAGPVVCLTADLETILARTAGNRSRPLLDHDARAERACKLMMERKSAYDRADLSIDTSTASIAAVVGRIREFLERKRGQAREARA